MNHHVLVFLYGNHKMVVPKKDIRDLGFNLYFPNNIYDTRLELLITPVKFNTIEQLKKSKRPLYYLNETNLYHSNPFNHMLDSYYHTSIPKPFSEYYGSNNKIVHITLKDIKDHHNKINIVLKDNKNARKKLEEINQNSPFISPIFTVNVIGKLNYEDSNYIFKRSRRYKLIEWIISQ